MHKKSLFITKKWSKQRSKVAIDRIIGPNWRHIPSHAQYIQPWDLQFTMNHSKVGLNEPSCLEEEPVNCDQNYNNQKNTDRSVIPPLCRLNPIETQIINPVIDTSKNNQTDTLRDDLKTWVLKRKINCTATDDLLKVLNRHGHSELPLCYRTLMGTPLNKIEYEKIGRGDYYHVGLEKIFAECIRLGLFQSQDFDIRLGLTVHVDGISYTSSSHLKGWPITGTINELPNVKPFLIGLYSGYTDPIDFDLYLSFLVDDLAKGIEGYTIGNYKITIKSIRILSDSMARLKVCHVMGPTSLRGCFCCSQIGTKALRQGTQYSNKIVPPMRTNQSFRNRVDPEHHHESHRKKPGIIERPILRVDMVNDVPVDPMHSTDLGSTNRTFKVIQ